MDTFKKSRRGFREHGLSRIKIPVSNATQRVLRDALRAESGFKSIETYKRSGNYFMFSKRSGDGTSSVRRLL